MRSAFRCSLGIDPFCNVLNVQFFSFLQYLQDAIILDSKPLTCIICGYMKPSDHEFLSLLLFSIFITKPRRDKE